MKKAVLVALIAMFACTTMAFAHCGVCGVGEAKAAGEGASHDEEHMHKAKEAGSMSEGEMVKESGSMAEESGSMMGSGMIKDGKKSKAKEASSY